MITADPPPRADVLGCKLDRVDLERAVTTCEHVIRTRGFAQHMAINVAKLMAMREDGRLRESIEQCELITADGQPVVWASRLLGDPLPERVAGIDLMEALLQRAPTAGYSVYILGAREEVLEAAVTQIRRRYPGVEIAGHRHGYYRDHEEEAVAASIRATRPDMLFVAMSSPRKENFLASHGRALGVPLVMGVGGSIDVIAGLTRRAPAPFRRAGLEWLVRLAQEPRRLARRYFSTNSKFLLVLGREVVKHHAGRPSRRPDGYRPSSPDQATSA